MSGHAPNSLKPAVHEASHFAILFLGGKPHADLVGPQAPYRDLLMEKIIVEPPRPKQGEFVDSDLRYAVESKAEAYCAGVAAEQMLLRQQKEEEPDARVYPDWAVVKSLFELVTPEYSRAQAFHARMSVYCRVSDLIAVHWASVLALAEAFSAEPCMPWWRAVHVFENAAACASSGVTVIQSDSGVSFSITPVTSVPSVTEKVTVEGPWDLP